MPTMYQKPHRILYILNLFVY